MPKKAWGGSNLADKYLNFFTFGEVSAATTSLQTFDYETGMSPRGGYIWEIHYLEIFFTILPTAVAAGVQYWQAGCISFVGGQATFPAVSSYGNVWIRRVSQYGNGTYNQPPWFEPMESSMFFPRPFLYAKNKLYLYYQTSASSASQGVDGRIGYTTHKISGPLLWEAVEQFLSES